MQVAVRNSYECPVFPQPDLAIFFDVFRASTTLLALVSQRPEKLFSANDEKTVRSYQQQGFLLVSEVFGGGLDNSPTQVLAEKPLGRNVIHKSTNLTNAIFHHQGAARMLIGGFVNATRLVNFVLQGPFKTVELIAAAHFGHRAEALEDLEGAKLVANLLVGINSPVDLAPIRSKVVARMERLGLGSSHHYWADAELALHRDAVPHLAEVLPFNESTVQVIEVR